MLGGLDAGELSHHGLLGLGDWLLFYRIPFLPSERDRPLHIPQISTLGQMAGGAIAPVQSDYISKSPGNPLKC
jgi:hypothetical protein